jgi:hypothetical protein
MRMPHATFHASFWKLLIRFWLIFDVIYFLNFDRMKLFIRDTTKFWLSEAVHSWHHQILIEWSFSFVTPPNIDWMKLFIRGTTKFWLNEVVHSWYHQILIEWSCSFVTPPNFDWMKLFIRDTTKCIYEICCLMFSMKLRDFITVRTDNQHIETHFIHCTERNYAQPDTRQRNSATLLFAILTVLNDVWE